MMNAGRGMWLGYALLVSLLTLGAWYQVEDRFAYELAENKERLAAEQGFMEALIHDLLQSGQGYGNVQDLVARWGAEGTHRVRLTVTTANGFELGRYERAASATHTLTLESDLEFGYDNQARLVFVGDLSAIYAERTQTRIQFLALLLLIASFGAYLVYSIHRRKQEILRYRRLSDQFATANKKLEAEIEVRKGTEQALSNERERVEVTLNSIGDAVVTTDAEGRITRVNPIAERLTGWSREEAIGHPIERIFRIQNSAGQPLDNPVRQVLHHGQLVGLDRDTVLIAHGGRCLQIADSAAPIRSPENAIDGVILVFRDVTEERRMRAALLESETRFRRLVESLVDHFFMTQGTQGDILYVSASVTAILGYTQDEFCARFQEFLTDHPRNAALATCSRQTLAGHLQPPQILEVRAKDHSIRLLEMRQVPSFDENGTILAAESIVHDITERRRVEAEQRLAASVFENTAEGIMVTDLQGRIQRVNRAFCAITGYAAGEVLGRTPKLLQSGRQSPQFYQELWQSLAEQGHWQGEIWNRHKSGALYPEWLSISRIPDPEEGNEQRYVGIFSDISRQKKAEEEIARLAFHDALTGLPNRLLLLERLETDLARAKRRGHVDALLFLDLDHFKHVKDSLGHGLGDAMLQEIAQRIRKVAHDYDIVARLGGDEFVVLINAIANTRQDALGRARRAAERIAAAIVEHPIAIAGHELHSSTSIGIALLPADADTPEEALRHADKAMHQAKSMGRNSIHFFTPEMQAEVERRLVLENELRRAIERNELELHYQPILDLANDRIAGLEALLRWHHPIHGEVSPTLFIPIAEETGLIFAIGEWVLKTACAQVRQWQVDGLAKLYVSINLSAAQFRQRDIAQGLQRILQETGLDPACLELEIPESLLIENVETSVQTFNELVQMGLTLAIDDFGTGCSSLSALRRFSLHKLKIDRSFVEDLPDSADATAIATIIVQMARILGLRTVAEGIENAAQWTYLQQLGCDFGQGYLCSRPVPAAEIPARLADPRLRATGEIRPST